MYYAEEAGEVMRLKSYTIRRDWGGTEREEKKGENRARVMFVAGLHVSFIRMLVISFALWCYVFQLRATASSSSALTAISHSIGIIPSAGKEVMKEPLVAGQASTG
ncbi:hypothetical protein BaRGS_00002364 [Batillaria attramentaria]|uniref:Uncharacterized protein n=1 Tax=Batillaria attramentaria TaxID=370345 RepID=A0ABD0M3J0_9CAEN